MDGVAAALNDGDEEEETDADALGELLGVEDGVGDVLEDTDGDGDKNGKRSGGRILSIGTPSRSALRWILAICFIALLIMRNCCLSSNLKISNNWACERKKQG